jgi:hypothetical protein
MIEKEFDNIDKEDIDALVQKAVCEKRDTEYKLQLPGGADKDTKEFLADVSSLANTSGGDLIYGVRDKLDEKGQPTGIPEAAEGVAESNPVAQETRLVSILRSGIDPRIPGVRITHLDGFPLGPVIVLRVPKSWVSPHMIKFQDWSRFYSRTSAGKHLLDVREIRAAFTASESLAAKISAFRSDRVGKILAGETPVPMEAGSKFVLHLLPVGAFAEPAVVDLRGAEATLGSSLVPMGPKFNGYGPVSFNFNGLFCRSGGASLKTDSYVQVFRNGAIEAVCAWHGDGSVLSGAVLDELVGATRRYTELQTRLGVGFPMFVAVSAVSVKGAWISPSIRVVRPTVGGQIDQDVLPAPEVLVEEKGANIRNVLRPALDTIWQASHWPGCPAYNDNGEWVGF